MRPTKISENVTLVFYGIPIWCPTTEASSFRYNGGNHFQGAGKQNELDYCLSIFLSLRTCTIIFQRKNTFCLAIAH